MRGVVQCRQAVLDVRTIGEGGVSRCEIDLDPEIVRTLPLARRPFQGWRYLEAKDAPADLSFDDHGSDLPAEVTVELRALGAW